MFQSFKRRFFYLKQQADTTYVMEFHKDDKKLEAKGAIFLDSAVSVNKVIALNINPLHSSVPQKVHFICYFLCGFLAADAIAVSLWSPLITSLILRVWNKFGHVSSLVKGKFLICN